MGSQRVGHSNTEGGSLNKKRLKPWATHKKTTGKCLFPHHDQIYNAVSTSPKSSLSYYPVKSHYGAPIMIPHNCQITPTSTSPK